MDKGFRPTQYRNLDVLRALAVLYVFICHGTLMLYSPVGFVARIFLVLGRLGVILFFVHTSLVLMQSLESLGPNTERWAMRFFVRRVFRIYPLAIGVILLALSLHTPYAPWDGPETAGLRTWGEIANVFLVQNILMVKPVIAPLWSLPIEVQMYAVLPLIFLAIRRKNWGKTMAGMWLISALAAGAVYRLTGKMYLLEFVPCFLCGPMAYKLRSGIKPRWPSGLWIPAVLAVTAVAVWLSVGIRPQWEAAAKEWAVCLALALLFPRIRDLNNRWLTGTCHAVAKYSYGIYLWHLFAFWIAFRLLPLRNPIYQISTAVLITLAASVVSFHVIEDPLIRLGKRFSDRLEAHHGTPRQHPVISPAQSDFQNSGLAAKPELL